jgi:hypothetical protein
MKTHNLKKLQNPQHSLTQVIESNDLEDIKCFFKEKKIKDIVI